MMEMLTNLVTQSGVGATQLSAILLGVLFLIMIIGLATGQELAFVLGGAGVVIGYLAWGGPGITIAMTKVYDQMQSYSMVAIPMFVLMANFLTHSKVADGLFLSIRYLLGPLKGGLGLAVIVVSTVFAATTGIVGASVVTMGMLSVPVLLKCGYKPSLACGMVCAGGSLGILIPPSIMLVSMGSYANVSVGKIFFAAIVPGLVLSLFYMIYVFVICHIHPDYGPAMSAEELAAMPLGERITGSLVNLIPPVILIVGVLGSIFTGWATPTEAAGVGALFSLILAIFYKQFSWKMLYDSLIDTAKTSAMVFIILFGASAFTGIFMSLDGDQLIATWISSVGIGKWGAFAIMMAIVFVMGMFLGTRQVQKEMASLAKKILELHASSELDAALTDWLDNQMVSEGTRERADRVIAALEPVKESSELLTELYENKDYLPKRSQWLIGGDGWSYDIGYGGLDHALAAGENINVLVLDTEVYSNTGGQASKATPTAAIAKFAASGKRTKKKDLGRIFMTYGYIYVAQVCIGADKAQTLKALAEAEAYPGPSIVIAYCPCINHGIKTGMGLSQMEAKHAVDCGYWALYRYNPQLVGTGVNPFTLDSKEPTMSFREFLMNEVRYASLLKAFPDEAEGLLEKTEKDAMERLAYYKKLAAEKE